MGPQLKFPTWPSHQPEVPVNMDSRLARCGEREGVSFALETHAWVALKGTSSTNARCQQFGRIVSHSHAHGRFRMLSLINPIT